MTNSLNTVVTTARALGHPARLRTLVMLRSGELCVCQITEILGLATSTVSAHLKELRLAGLVSERKQGRWVYVTLADTPTSRGWLEIAFAGLCDDVVKTDEVRVGELRRVPVTDLCRYGFDQAARMLAGEPHEKRKED